MIQMKNWIKTCRRLVETNDALLYLAIIKNVLGDEWLNNKLFRFGASRLAIIYYLKFIIKK